MNEQESAETVIAIAKSLVELVNATTPSWEKAFYRFESDGSSVKTNGSYVIQGHAKIFDVMAHRPAFVELRNLGERLRDSLEKNGEKFYVCLLTVDRDLNFVVEYDYRNSDRWKISKANGGTGFPGA